MLRLLIAILLLILPCAGSARATPGEDAQAARDLIGRGAAAFEVGDIIAATRHWSDAITLCRIATAPALEAEALARRGEAYRVEGLFREASADLTMALARAEQAGDETMIAASSGALGNLAFMTRRTAVAEPMLRRSNDLAIHLHDPGIAAASANDLGNLLAATGRAGEAAAAYAEAVRQAETAGDDALAATGEINAARLAVQSGDPSASVLLARAVGRLEHLPTRHNVGLALVSAGAVAFAGTNRAADALNATARAAFRDAAAIGAHLGRPALESVALGGQGRLAEADRHWPEAAALTRAALFKAQLAGAVDLSFRWDWQLARIDRAQGQEDRAIAGYRRAIGALQAVRQDIPVEYRDGQSSFRQTFGPLYTEFADLLLRRATRDPTAAQALIREVRETLEGLKESELQDYFRDS